MIDRNRDKCYFIQEGKWIIGETNSLSSPDDILECKHMYAAEFELPFVNGINPLGQTLVAIAKNRNNYEFVKTGVKLADGKEIIIFCDSAIKDNAKQWVINLTKDSSDFSLKRRIDLSKMCKMDVSALGNFKKTYHYNDFWMDIEHDFIFFAGEEHISSTRLLVNSVQVKYFDLFYSKKAAVSNEIFAKIGDKIQHIISKTVLKN